MNLRGTIKVENIANKKQSILGNMFDLNRDGKMSVFERAAELQFLDSVTKNGARNS